MTRPTPLFRPRRAAFARASAALLALSLAGAGLVGCSGSIDVRSSSDDSTASGPAAQAGAADRFYGQSVEWGDCEEGDPAEAQCGEIEVPLNWEDPEGETITVALARVQTADPEARLGSLLFNPGGPGISGIQGLTAQLTQTPEPVLAAYDLVAFDPRGVGRSTPVDCLDDPELDAYLAEFSPDDEAGEAAPAEFGAAEFGAACAERTGELLGFVDTASAARDLDAIRAVLGDEALNYLGYSYGTLLGAAYAELFPERVGRLVLDGAADPSKNARDRFPEQMAAFDRSLTAFATACAATEDCPLGDNADQILAAVVEFLQNALEQPLPLPDGRELTQEMALTGIMFGLYSEDRWELLGAALYNAYAGDGVMLSMAYDFYNDRDTETGRFATNQSEAGQAINCLDQPRGDDDPAVIAAQDQALVEAAPIFGQFTSTAPSCANWPEPRRLTPHAVAAPGAAPVLVVGTTGDPATPYEQAVALAEQLESGVLLTYEGEQHTAYGTANSQCVDDAVNAFLIDGTMPPEGTRC
ncbi:MAG: alpha/beta hydrolase [Bifidobacteriaceae bacterium]|nr:alpha/beta hydrolase [Bifidobacteriaceae bacterium]